MSWDLEKDGRYSVQSTYKAISNDAWQLSEEASSSVNDVWRIIWSASVSSRVKLFAWRACIDALPTRLGLSKRVRSMSAACSMCGAMEETAFHAIYECGLAQSVWEVCSLDSLLPRTAITLSSGGWLAFMSMGMMKVRFVNVMLGYLEFDLQSGNGGRV